MSVLFLIIYHFDFDGRIAVLLSLLSLPMSMFLPRHELRRNNDIILSVLYLVIYSDLSLVMRKPDFCICENKDADQLRSNCATDQRLCLRYTDSTIPLLPKSEISSLWTCSVAVQPGLCRTWSDTQKTGFLTTRLILSDARLVVEWLDNEVLETIGYNVLILFFRLPILSFKPIR